MESAMPTNPFETRNPFSVTAPGIPSASTATVPDQAQVTQVSGQGYDASTATTERADPTLRTVQDNELVQRQLEQIIGNDSPLIQRARARAQEQMASRGLVNSSMAIGASDAAAYDVALPIAQADAATYSGTARDNQAVQNSMAQFNAGEFNQTGRINAGLISDARRFGADANNVASRANADAANRAALQRSDQDAATRRFNAEQQNINARTQADMQFRAAMQNSDAQVRAALQVMDNEFAAQRQNSAASSEVWRQYQTSATQIMTSDLPAESKQEMIRQLTQQTRQAMIATGAMDQAQVDYILTMADLPAPGGNSSAAGATAAPGAAGGAGAAPPAAAPPVAPPSTPGGAGSAIPVAPGNFWDPWASGNATA
jgi:hypothetical protein